MFGRIRRNSDCSHLWPFLIQNNGVTFPPYLPRLQQSLVSSHLLLCTRLPALCACISKCQRWRACVDLALVQEVSVLSPPNLFTHNTEHRERTVTHKDKLFCVILSHSFFLSVSISLTCSVHAHTKSCTDKHQSISACLRVLFLSVYMRDFECDSEREA